MERYCYLRAGIRLALSCALLAVFMSAAIRSVQLSRREHLLRSGRLNTAAPMVGDAEMAWRLAGAEEISNARRAALLREGVRMNPRYTAAWIDLAFTAEEAGAFENAERYLLDAAARDRTYAPAWSLANFYFRRGRTQECLLWCRSVAEVAVENLRPVFDLCWRATDDGARILRDALPARPEVLRRYLRFLLDENHAPAASVVALRLLDGDAAASLPALLDYCDRSVAGTGTSGSAVAVWNGLARRGLIAGAPFPDAGGNGMDKIYIPTEPHAFDWHLHENEGIAISRGQGEVAIQFSGKQAESADLLDEFVPVAPGRRYALTVQAACAPECVLPEVGIEWRVCAPEERRENCALVADGTAGPFGGDLARLWLRYRRPQGQVRYEGVVTIARAALTAVHH